MVLFVQEAFDSLANHGFNFAAILVRNENKLLYTESRLGNVLLFPEKKKKEKGGLSYENNQPFPIQHFVFLLQS